MQIGSISNSTHSLLRQNGAAGGNQSAEAEEVQKKFRQFVGEMFFGQVLKSMRSTQQEPAYFHGGRAEEVFQSQLDQVLAEEMTEASAHEIADPMFRQQFPREAALLEAQSELGQVTLDDLQSLARR